MRLDLDAYDENAALDAVEPPVLETAATRLVRLPVHGAPATPELVVLVRQDPDESDELVTVEAVYLPALVSADLLKKYGSVGPSAMIKYLKESAQTATSLEVGLLKCALGLPANTARALLHPFGAAATFLKSHARDQAAIAVLNNILGSYKEVKPLSQTPLYAADRLASVRPPLVVVTPAHARRRLIAEGREDAEALFSTEIENVALLFDRSMDDVRKFSQLAELRSKYGLTPPVFMAKKARLAGIITSMVAALIGYHVEVYNALPPTTFDELFGQSATVVLEYVALQLDASEEKAEVPSTLCGPTTLTQDLTAVSLVYQYKALAAIAASERVMTDELMRLAVTFQNFARGIDAVVPIKLHHVVNVERFKDPVAVVSRIEGFISQTSVLKTPLTSMTQAVQVRDAALLGVLGAVGGGHRISQAVATVQRADIAACIECKKPDCPGNRIEYDLSSGVVKLRFSHHKNERAARGQAVRALHVDIKHEALAKVLDVYTTDARAVLHSPVGDTSPLLFLTREGKELGNGGVERWHQPIGAARASANQLVVEVTGRALKISPGMTARDLRRLWVGLVQNSTLEADVRATLFGVIGTSERQVRRTYDVQIVSRALENLSSSIRQLAAENVGIGDDLGDQHDRVILLQGEDRRGEREGREREGEDGEEEFAQEVVRSKRRGEEHEIDDAPHLKTPPEKKRITLGDVIPAFRKLEGVTEAEYQRAKKSYEEQRPSHERLRSDFLEAKDIAESPNYRHDKAVQADFLRKKKAYDDENIIFQSVRQQWITAQNARRRH